MKIKDGFVLREICGEKVLSEEGSLNVNMSKLIKLNDTAAFLIESVGSSEFTAERLADLLCGQYEVARETALTDAEKLCETLVKYGIAE